MHGEFQSGCLLEFPKPDTAPLLRGEEDDEEEDEDEIDGENDAVIDGVNDGVIDEALGVVEDRRQPSPTKLAPRGSPSCTMPVSVIWPQ